MESSLTRQGEWNYMSRLIWETRTVSRPVWLCRNFFFRRFSWTCWAVDSFISSHGAQQVLGLHSDEEGKKKISCWWPDTHVAIDLDQELTFIVFVLTLTHSKKLKKKKFYLCVFSLSWFYLPVLFVFLPYFTCVLSFTALVLFAVVHLLFVFTLHFCCVCVLVVLSVSRQVCPCLHAYYF